MAIRVHQLAKELGVTSKDIMQEAQNHGIVVQNHMGSLTEAEANLIRAFLYVPGATPAPAKAPAKAPTKTEGPLPAAGSPSLAAPAHAAESETHAASASAAGSPAADAAQAAPAFRIAPSVRPPAGPAPLPQSQPLSDESEIEAPPETAEVEETVAAIEDEGDGDEKKDEAAPAAPTHRMMAQIRPPTMKKAGEAAPTEKAPAAESAPPAPRVVTPMTAISPAASRTVISSPLQSPERPTTREPAVRRGGTIVGRKELPVAPPKTDGRPGFGQGRTPVTSNDGMVQTTSEGSKRTFVRQAGGTVGGPMARGRGPIGGTGAPGFNRGRTDRDAGRPQFGKKMQMVLPDARPKSVEIKMPISIKDLAAAMGLKANILIEKLMRDHKKLFNLNAALDKDTVELLGMDFDVEIKVLEADDVEKNFISQEVEAFTGDPADLVPRPPIITFLGHVDHGKTSLLDYIRKTRIAEREYGGITQHIGAWRVATEKGDVVFLDTPGHKAFTEMRARGAHLTDVVVLVVAADDGIMPQTEEAVAHARAAETTIVVAINKCDKPEANPMKVRQQLVGIGLQPEEWGGDTVCVDVSALTGQGMDKLLDYLALVTELKELKANPKRPGVGTVVEAMQKKGEGNVIRLLMTDGTLHRGDNFLCGHVFGKVKAIRLQGGKVVNDAGPCWPVEIGGLSELPQAGDKFYVVKDADKAKAIADERARAIRDRRLAVTQHINLESLLKQSQTGQLNIVLKVDTTGSLEVLKKSIMELSHAEIQPRIIHAAVGPVSETDVTLADASNAVVLGFHVTDSAAARKQAEESGVEVRHYHVIYKLLDELKEAIEGRLAPEEKETTTGHVEVRQVFKVSKIGTIAGCYVADGVIRRTARVRLMRNGILIHEGKIESLRHMKDDVKEAKEGHECGIRIEGYDDIKVGDMIEPYEIEKIKRTLDQVSG